MKPTKSKLLILDRHARWWSDEKGISFAFQNKVGEWFVLKSSKPTDKPTEKPTNFFKKPRESEENYNNHLLVIGLAAVLGVSLGLNLIGFYLLK